MTIDRRTFLQEAAFFAMTPAIAAFLPRTSIAQQPRAKSAVEKLEGGTESKLVEFKIDGWKLSAERPTENEFLISINQSWRTAWR
jgi:hypothetical protein